MMPEKKESYFADAAEILRFSNVTSTANASK
jgi:hypothetical protein